MQPFDNQMTMLEYSFDTGVNQAQQPTQANDIRVYLLIQNFGINPLLVTFGKKAQGNPGAIRINGGAEKEWVIRVPIESINLSSILGTTGVILEGRMLPERRR